MQIVDHFTRDYMVFLPLHKWHWICQSNVFWSLESYLFFFRQTIKKKLQLTVRAEDLRNKTYYTGQCEIWRDISRVATVLSRAEGEWKYKVRVKWLHISQWPSVINCLLHTLLVQLNAYQVFHRVFQPFQPFHDCSYDYVIQKAVIKSIRMLSV